MSKHDLLGYLGKATQVGREVIGRYAAPEPFYVHTATADGEAWTWPGVDADVSELLILAGSKNLGSMKLSFYEAVTASNYLPLFGQDSFEAGGIKLSDIYITFETAGDSVHIAYVKAGEGDLEDLDTV